MTLSDVGTAMIAGRPASEVINLTKDMTDIELALSALTVQSSYLNLLNHYKSHRRKIVRMYRVEYSILYAEVYRRLNEQGGSIKGTSLQSVTR